MVRSRVQGSFLINILLTYLPTTHVDINSDCSIRYRPRLPLATSCAVALTDQSTIFIQNTSLSLLHVAAHTPQFHPLNLRVTCLMLSCVLLKTPGPEICSIWRPSTPQTCCCASNILDPLSFVPGRPQPSGNTVSIERWMVTVFRSIDMDLRLVICWTRSASLLTRTTEPWPLMTMPLVHHWSFFTFGYGQSHSNSYPCPFLLLLTLNFENKMFICCLKYLR